MECKDCLFFFDDYNVDELEAEERAKISEHLAACESCADFYQAFRRQEQAVEQYLLRAEASPALWANLQTQIRNEKVVPLHFQTRTISGKFKSVFDNFDSIFSPRVLAFSALAVVVTCTLVFLLVRHNNYPAQHAQNNSEMSPVSRMNEPTNVNQSSTNGEAEKANSQNGRKIPSRAAMAKQIAETKIERSTRQDVPPLRKNPKPKTTEKAAWRGEQKGKDVLPGEEKYLEVIAGLTEEVKSIEPGLPPALSREYKRNLSAVDKAIEETCKSARRHPKNQDVMNFVVAAYEGKIALLNEVAKQNQ